jgi:hypothetical protein
MNTMPSRDIAKDIDIVRELDRMQDTFYKHVDREILNIRDDDSPIKELCAAADAFAVDWRACEDKFGLSAGSLRLKISEMICELSAEAENHLHAAKVSTESLQDAADAWTEILWNRNVRRPNDDGSVCKHF